MRAEKTGRQAESSEALEVRAARHEDFDGVAFLFGRIPGTVGPLRREAWDRALAALTWVAVEGSRIVGFAMVKWADRRALLHLVAVDERVEGRGVASRLFDALRAWALGAGCVAAHVNIHQENRKTLEIARRFGGEELYAAAVVAIPWSSLERLPEAARAVAVRPVAPEDDTALEAAFDIWPGALGSARGRGGVVLGAFDVRTASALPLGLACWDPARGGVFPLEAPTAGLARALLAAVRDSVGEDAPPEILLHLKKQPSTVEALLAAGGSLRDTFAHLRFALAHA